MRLTTLLSCLVAATIATPANATAIFKITEIYAGQNGEDGTPDWIEVTNFGDTDGDTGTLYYDDETPTVASGIQLPSFTLSPTESAVFIVTSDVTSSSVAEFTTIWGSIANLAAADGGGKLNQNGDTAAILLGDGTVVDSATFGSGFANTLKTIDFVSGSPVDSALGVNGAYESNAFFNDNLSLPGDMATLIGSPGTITSVPEPAALLMMLVAMGSVALDRRV